MDLGPLVLDQTSSAFTLAIAILPTICGKYGSQALFLPMVVFRNLGVLNLFLVQLQRDTTQLATPWSWT